MTATPAASATPTSQSQRSKAEERVEVGLDRGRVRCFDLERALIRLASGATVSPPFDLRLRWRKHTVHWEDSCAPARANPKLQNCNRGSRRIGAECIDPRSLFLPITLGHNPDCERLRTQAASKGRRQRA
jgi:hypothetical protein